MRKGKNLECYFPGTAGGVDVAAGVFGAATVGALEFGMGVLLEASSEVVTSTTAGFSGSAFKRFSAGVGIHTN